MSAHQEALREAVIEYARAGFRMLPLFGVITGTDGQRCCECPKGSACESSGKHPRRKRWPQTATCNPSSGLAWLKRWSDMNLGLATGRQSGVVVLDVDPRHGGDESIAKLAELHGPLPPTRRHNTPSGGYHLLFGWELGRPVGNRLPALSGASGIDVRGEGGLIVAPPSRHLKGVYRVDASSPTELARLPEWLLEGVAVEPAELTPHDRADRWAVAALRNECRAIKEAPQGNRNETLFTASWKIGEIIAGGGLDQEKATHELSSAGLHAGLDEPEVDDVVARGLDYGAERPRVADPPFSGRAEALAVVDEIHGAIRGVTWSGHAGTRHRAVLEAMVSLARHQGGPQITAGVRRIALEAGYSDHATVMRALKRVARSSMGVPNAQGNQSRGSQRVEASRPHPGRMAERRLRVIGRGSRRSGVDTRAIK